MNGKRIIIRIKRVYEEPEEADGRRVLVDRLWARGLSKEKAKVDVWVKEIAPSTELRSWYGHDPDKWLEFKTRYAAELEVIFYFFTCPQISRILKRLKLHGIIKKASNSYKYYLTKMGKEVTITATKIKTFVIIPALNY